MHELTCNPEFEERGKLIQSMLDKIYPISPEMPKEVRESIDQERQILVMRSGWNDLTIEELRKVASG